MLSSNTSAWQLAYVASLVSEVHLLLYVSFGKLKTILLPKKLNRWVTILFSNHDKVQFEAVFIVMNRSFWNQKSQNVLELFSVP